MHILMGIEIIVLEFLSFCLLSVDVNHTAKLVLQSFSLHNFTEALRE